MILVTLCFVFLCFFKFRVQADESEGFPIKDGSVLLHHLFKRTVGQQQPVPLTDSDLSANTRTYSNGPAGSTNSNQHYAFGTNTYTPSRARNPASRNRDTPDTRRIAGSYPVGPIIPIYGYRTHTNQRNQIPVDPAGQTTSSRRTNAGSQVPYNRRNTGGGQTQYYRTTNTGSVQPANTRQRSTYPHSPSGVSVYSSNNQQGGTYNPSSGALQPTYTRQSGVYPYNPSAPFGCQETGIRIRINGMECSQAIDHFGAFLCYRHEHTSRDCCEKCRPLKNPSRVGCEYGDHSYQCRQIQAFDCYDLRNRQSCCDTCEQFRTGEVNCEYGDMTPRCQRVAQNPSLCYIPENQRLCCSTCRRVSSTDNPDCPWGDQNSELCRPFDQYGGVRINCYSDPVRRLCCQTCKRLEDRMPDNVPHSCRYGDRPVIFNTNQFGSLNCTSFFRHFSVDQCTLNQAVAINCCYTCFRYTRSGG